MLVTFQLLASLCSQFYSLHSQLYTTFCRSIQCACHHLNPYNFIRSLVRSYLKTHARAQHTHTHKIPLSHSLRLSYIHTFWNTHSVEPHTHSLPWSQLAQYIYLKFYVYRTHSNIFLYLIFKYSKYVNLSRTKLGQLTWTDYSIIMLIWNLCTPVNILFPSIAVPLIFTFLVSYVLNCICKLQTLTICFYKLYIKSDK